MPATQEESIARTDVIQLTDIRSVYEDAPDDSQSRSSRHNIFLPHVLEPDASPLPSRNHPIRTKSLALLTSLHFSSTWGDRCFEFAAYLFLIQIFRSTLLPASIFGFCTTGAAIVLSGWMGHLVDKRHRLRILQLAIFFQKVATASAYAAFTAIFFIDKLLEAGSQGKNAEGPIWALFIAIVLSGMVIKLATVCIQISIERDWATTIGEGDTVRLMRINTWLRRIDLICKLISPLFVSMLTTAVSYRFAAAFLCGMAVTTASIEIPLSHVVYKMFPALESEYQQRMANSRDADQKSHNQKFSFKRWIDPRPTFRDWQEFSHFPVFYNHTSKPLETGMSRLISSSVSWCLQTIIDSPFIAGMRAICTVTGLIGTILLPHVERKIGLIRCGAWSIWSEVVTLVPTVLALYIGVPKGIGHGPAYNNAMLFGGMALSRVGLWMFDLAQLQILQEALEHHPRRNTLTALQYSLMNTFDMLKYVLTMILSDPQQFRWAGLVSWIVVFFGGLLYGVYVYKSRGHIVHVEWVYRVIGKKNE
ncbi:iron transporter [Desarmillaria tabescens]|uniref:Solute carrier family 40 member n=1 Tax=Armillaria tabescens TaxID=1929756 RepID=A0AA39KBD6_ARMTA|nr:iron transporter [Desarmillaria tabescens]KAK0458031.1 iron transporter [Desarmillaria tabescens]